MCLQDWQIGRLIRTQVTQINTQSAPQVIAQRNKDRVAITIINQEDNTLWVVPDIDANYNLGFPLSGARMTTVSSGSGTIVVPVHNETVALTSANNVISADYTGTIAIPEVSIADTNSNSVLTELAATYLHFTVKDHGDLPTKRWSAFFRLSTGNITIIEYILPEDVLHLTPEQLRQRA